jgi:hypothetical protein
VKTVYSNLYEITELQQKIMRFVDYWVHIEKKPIPQKTIIEEMVAHGQNNRTVEASLTSLLRLGYIRKAVIISNKTYYTQLRRI